MASGYFCCARCRTALTPPLVLLTDLTRLGEQEQQPHVPVGHYTCATGRYDYWTTAIGTGNYLLNLADLLHVRPHPDQRRRLGCCGPAGTDGKNLLCLTCGYEVGTEHADCHMAHFAELAPADVVLVTSATPQTL